MLLGFSLSLNKQHTYSIFPVDLILTIGITHSNNNIIIVSTEMRYTSLCSSNKNREEIQIMKLTLYSGIKNQLTVVTYACYLTLDPVTIKHFNHGHL